MALATRIAASAAALLLISCQSWPSLEVPLSTYWVKNRSGHNLTCQRGSGLAGWGDSFKFSRNQILTGPGMMDHFMRCQGAASGELHLRPGVRFDLRMSDANRLVLVPR